MDDLVVQRQEGLYCPPGDFYIDPWRPVDRAVITHAHGDHSRRGNAHYLAAAPAEGVLRTRLGEIDLQTLPYGETIDHFGVRLSFIRPATCSARRRCGSSTTAASGSPRATTTSPAAPSTRARTTPPARRSSRCAATASSPNRPSACRSTAGRRRRELFAEIDEWWRANADAGRASLLMGYAFGKAQRILKGVDRSIGPIVVHGAVEPLNRAYRAAGVDLPETPIATEIKDKTLFRRALIVAPPSVQGSTWTRRFGDYSDAFASGWMQLRGARRRRSVDRGFVLSDHADWPGLQRAIAATGAERVIVTHGYEAVMVRWLSDQGLEAGAFATEYGDDDDAPVDDAAVDDAGA